MHGEWYVFMQHCATIFGDGYIAVIWRNAVFLRKPFRDWQARSVGKYRNGNFLTGQIRFSHQRIAINFSTDKQIAGFDKVGRCITAYNALTAAPAASIARMPGTVSEIPGLNPYTDRDWKPVLQRPRCASTGSTRYLRRCRGSRRGSLACVNRPLQVVCDPDREPRFLWNHFFI